MFGKLKEMMAGGSNKLAGKTDLLEGLWAAVALVTYADGSANDDEVATAITSLENHAIVGAAFKAHEIEQAGNKQLARAKGGMAGKLALKRELAEAKAKNTFEEMEMLVMIALDVAMADGSVGDAEKAVLKDIGKIVGVPVDQYL
jgi:tellurite resistance protein